MEDEALALADMDYDCPLVEKMVHSFSVPQTLKISL